MSAIKKGDLVMVVRTTLCCGHVTPMFGHIFKVSGFSPSDPYMQCNYCGSFGCRKMAKGGHRNVELLRLRKIDPDQASDREREFDRLSRKEQHPLVVGDLDTQRRIMDESLAGSNNRS